MVESLDKQLLKLESYIRNIERSIGVVFQFPNVNKNDHFNILNKSVLKNLALFKNNFENLDNITKLKLESFSSDFDIFVNNISIDLGKFKTNKDEKLFKNLKTYFKILEELSKKFSKVRKSL